MKNVVDVADALTSIYSWQDKRDQDELMGYLNKYLYFPQCQKFIVANVKNIRSGNTQDLQQIYQKLMQGGEVDLAKKVELLISGEFSISEDFFTKLELYIESDIFYRNIEHTLTNIVEQYR